MKILAILCDEKTNPIQSQTKPILGKGKSKKAKGKMKVYPEFLRRGYLKKQSQFVLGRIVVKSYLEGNYGNKLPCGVCKNKAKQSQSVRKELPDRFWELSRNRKA